jgi:hypothetical protein
MPLCARLNCGSPKRLLRFPLTLKVGRDFRSERIVGFVDLIGRGPLFCGRTGALRRSEPIVELNRLHKAPEVCGFTPKPFTVDREAAMFAFENVGAMVAP